MQLLPTAHLFRAHQLYCHGEGSIEQPHSPDGGDEPEGEVGPVLGHEGAHQRGRGGHEDAAEQPEPPPVVVREEAEDEAPDHEAQHVAATREGWLQQHTAVHQQQHVKL